jgi:hypothetical protein
MKLKERLVGAFFGPLIDAKVTERLAAASLSSPNIASEDALWRKLTTQADRNLLPIEQDRMIEIAYWLWQTNPLAGWLIDITTSFIVAEGLPYEAKNEDVKAVLDGFWNDPVNRMPLYFPKHIDELHIFGELCFPAFTAAQTGRVRLGYVDPAAISDVITDPENVKIPIGVLVRPWTGSIGGYLVDTPAKAYRTILPEEADFVLSAGAKTLRNQFTDGDCFFYAINNVTNSPRGRSSLLPTADWLDAYEQFLFDYADKWPLQNAFIWDLLVTGGGDKEIKEQIAQFSKKPGSVFGHNEKVTLTPSAPKLEALDASTGARLFRNHIMGRWGYPEHWFGGGGDVNRATASEMDLPALKMLGRKQLQVKYILEDMLGYQVRQARNARYLRVTDDEAKQYSVTTPEMASKDIAKFSTAAAQMATAIAGAEMQGWVDKETARKLWASIVSFTGVDIDLDEVRANLEEQAAKKGYEDYKDRGKTAADAARKMEDGSGKQRSGDFATSDFATVGGKRISRRDLINGGAK